VKNYSFNKEMNILKSRRKAFLLLTMLLAGGMASAQVVIKGTVYGGGEGIRSDQRTGLVTGNTKVILNGGIIERSLYGGGELGSVGTFTEFYEATGAHVAGEPKTCAEGTGKTELLIRGGQVGRDEAIMPVPGASTYEDDLGYVFCGSRGEADSLTYSLANLLAVVKETHLKITGSALVTASVYGGCENGLVMGNTHVEIAGGQIGTGYNKNTQVHDGIYSETQWNTVIQKIKDGTFTDADAVAFHECDHWSYGDASGNYLTYDIYADSVGYNSHGGALHASDGHTFYGNVFGGGSGYYPFWDRDNRKAVWRRSAGRVWGNTVVDITSGHILTSVYGGNEQTDVMGNSTVNMTGGTLGVPRSFQAIKDHPVTCYLFGGGKGDQRVMFNTWTNVENAVVNISKDAFIFGSVFGGGEDGHVLSDVNLTVKDFVDANGAVVSPFIGNWGNTSFDGNVFGAGRGYSGDALTAGGVGGNTEVNIEGGTMLGSIYGGGRLASVGCYFVDTDDDNYGNLKEDDDDDTYGYTVVNIKGGVIGNTIETISDDFGNYIGGNVFGGSKGRLTKLDNTTVIADWEDLGKVKQTTVNINQASGKNLVIKGHVYGGGEVGCVEQNTLVNIDKGTIGYDYSEGTNHIRQGGDVYGGGMGLLTNAYDNSQVPVKLENAGLVKGNTTVDMSDGFVQRSLYGGGKYGSVGTFTSHYTESDATGFHIVGEPKACEEGTGLAKVLISGGQVGFTQTLMPAPGTTTYGDDFGYVFCGSRGEADSLTYKKANFLAVVDSTYLEISNNALITASAYGGCENGLVLRDTHVKIAGGQIGVGYNKNTTPPSWDAPYTDEQWNRAITAVKTGAMTDAIATSFNDCDAWPYGNGTLNGQGYPNGPFKVYDIYADPQHYSEYWETEQEFASISATDGNTFFGKVYGGGSGYYPIAPGVWRRSAGRVNGNTLVEITGGHILTAVFGGNEMTDVLGTATVNISGGTVGVPRTFNEIKITPTTCHVFGSGLGDTRTRFNTWTNVENVVMNITGGTVFGSVFGGGEDGHVLSDVTLSVSQTNENVPTLIGTYGHTLFDGNVFGGGRGFSGDALTAGSVGGNTEVNIEGGQVLGSVYGGGRLASVGISFVQPDNNVNYGHLQNGTDHGYTTVNVTGGTIGGFYENDYTIEQHRISGNVYGGSKGRLTKMDYVTMNPHWPSLAKVKQTEVNIDGENVVIKGDVFGGGEIGTVRDSTQVVVKNGTLMRDLFGGGYGSTSTATVAGCDSTNMTPVMIAGHVYGRTDATVSGGLVKHNVYGGGEYAKVGVDVNHVNTIRQSTVSLNGGTIGSHDADGNLFGGMVYGGGMGILADTTVAMVLGSTYIYDTLPNNAENHAYVLGHIHGGGEKALVQKDTYLTLGSVEVGTLAEATGTETKTLPNGTTVTLYETRALEGGRVFGGGQGVENVDYRHAALVMGNTNTEITGTARVKGSVYGGGELASVGLGGTQPDNDEYTGSATVVISGGTIGPLNGSQYNGNVFGGGKGHEELSVLNDVYYATVDSTHVVIKTSANIAGSVFGGGANGRVLGNASTDIQGGTIGTTGLTEWDGNVYGGGRNINAFNNTTAAVFGNTDIQMSGGIIKANMYGGGRFGSVGMNFTDDTHTSIDTIQGADHGYVNINITGGTIGDAYVQYLGTYDPNDESDDMPRTGYVFGGGRGIMEADKINKLGNVKGTHVTVGGTAKVLSSVYGGGERGIVYDSTYVKMTGNAEVGEPDLAVRENMALHRGDVYGGGCGYDSIWNATTSAYEFLHEAGSVKGNARIEMDGSKVYGNIFGACRLTDVLGHASVIISGGEVGWERSVENINARPDFGYVYAAGRGEPQERFKTWTTVDSTYAEVSGGHIWSSLNGGGEEGHVKRNTHVLVKGGTIGTVGSTGNEGNVFGAGRGKHPIITGVASAAVSGNTQVDIKDGRIMGSVFGGGNRGSVGVCYTPITIDGQAYQIGDTIQGTDHGYTLVNVSGGQIGHEDTGGRTGGNVYGGSRGVVVDPAITTVYRDMANVKQTEVNITQADGKQTFIMGSVFGGGEDGHVFKDTYVNVSNGQIGGSAYNPSSPSLCNDSYHGNVYGGGRGLDTYTNETGTHYSTTAGVVYGNTHVMIKGGRVTRNVYGGGNMSSVGIANEVPDASGNYHTGWANVTLTENAYVGVTPNSVNRNGMVFGSGHGRAGEAYKDLSMVKNTKVIITGNSKVTGTVYGSGEDGHTRRRTDVLIGDATVNGSTVDGSGVVIGTNGVPGLDGNVYGGGRGLDTYTGTDGQQHYSSTAGLTGISTNIEINNGQVKGSVFGGGRLASVGYEDVLDLSSGSIPDDYGMATVLITGDAQIGTKSSLYDNGHVFGSGKGNIGENFINLAYVHETDVTVNGNAKVYGSVFGGGEDGHVKAYTYTVGENTYTKEGNTHVTIGSPINNVLSTCNIGYEGLPSIGMDTLRGNVYGGGRGLDEVLIGETSNPSPTAGRVEGNTKVDVLGGSVWHDVFGGGSEAVVMGQKVTNIVGGYVDDDVYGGSNFIPVTDAVWAHSGLKTVNVRGGRVHHNVYGCSHKSNDGMLDEGDEYAKTWTSFVNISGGTIDGSVHGAGYAGLVNGSVCVNIGKNAIESAPNQAANVNRYKSHEGSWDQAGTVSLTASPLVIGGSVYGGSDYYGSATTNDFNDYDQTGYALIFIDGTGYNTTDNTGSYMTINGGLFGSGTHTESGALGRHILLRNYGTRTPNDNGEMASATRTLTTIQRVNNLVIDHANVNLSGLTDISSTTDTTRYAVMRVKDTLAVINASGLALKGTEEHPVVYMDSIHMVRSMKLASSDASIYNHNLNQLDDHSWYWLGVKDQSNDPKLYYINGTTNNLVSETPLDYDKENVLLFNHKSKLWVRYTQGTTNYYGELYGFFRMRADAYEPYYIEESFAYARPKTASFPGVADDNVSDGGFLSYNIAYNYFTDEGAQYTKTKQHPYRHPYLGYRADHPNQEYRLWVDIPEHPKQWYVDGTRGWGHDDKSKKGDQAGLFPDKPKKTVFGVRTYDEETHTGDYGGIVTEMFEPEVSPDRYLNFHYSEDVIYVVGALTEFDNAILRDSITGTEPNEIHHPNYPLRLFRYPGGHKMSNGQYDNGAGGYTPNEHSYTAWGAGNGNVGPGANYGAMLNVKADSTITMKGVVMDGLYGNPLLEADSTAHMILPADNTYDVTNLYNPAAVIEPLVITNDNSTLSVGDSTVLMRGYNNTNAEVWYVNPFAERDAVGIQGGAMYVDTTATVNVSGKVYITDNKQYLKIGDAAAKVINCNVYLPTFSNHLYITNTLFEGSDTESASKIGITSPMANDAPSYINNTFSPVAEASNSTWAASAWDHLNFYDDLGWFFVNENVVNNDVNHKRTAYYDGTATTPQQPNPINANLNEKTLFFGWTWANIVRTNPGTDSFETLTEGANTTIKIKDNKGLAWLISMTSGMNGVGASSTDFSGVNKKIKQTADIDLLQYVWVPIGSAADEVNHHNKFAGDYDGQGHLIKNLYIEYIGIGDSIYERQDYGLFGKTFKPIVNRTFVVSGKVNPVIANASTFNPAITAANTFNVGGLVGYQEQGAVTNSEAAVKIGCPDRNGSGIIAGGLVAKVVSGVVHSSMAMPEISIGASAAGPMGGLVGNAANNSSIENSFVNATFNINQSNQSVKAAGLLGRIDGTEMKNCYAHMRNELTNTPVFKGMINQFVGTNNDIDYCYVEQGYTFENCGEHSNNYTSTTSPDKLGYMYYDNIIEGDTTLVARLNINAMAMNKLGNDSTYAHWSRPGLAEINLDLPVLLLCEFDGEAIYQGKFRSVGTYEGGRALQYGGPVRDDNELDSALARTLEKDEDDQDIPDYLFVYGDVINVGSNLAITQSKVSYHEDVSIIDPGCLSQFANNYVGITFDNSFGNATSTPGINVGLIGMGGYPLPRDWHMFSTPLSNAPLGFDYKGHNDSDTYSGSDHSDADHYNNPWKSKEQEFTWLNNNVPGDKRYWMYGWDNSLSQMMNPTATIDGDSWVDGYFPSQRGDLFNSNVNELYFVHPDSDECPVEGQYRYPYGMDLYSWSEPEYHWINFKRNGPNHWHSDTPHVHLDYRTEEATNHLTPGLNVNEKTLISGKGYMAAITKETFMQSHGYLNSDVNGEGQYIKLSNTPSSLMPGWNLVGNPYHGYLDFQEVAVGDNLDVLSADNYISGNPDEGAFYVVYNADKYTKPSSRSAFRYYPKNGSVNGDYAERYLHPHQGFYVKAKGNSPLRFTKNMLSTRATVAANGEESHLRDERPAYPLVNLYLSSDQGCSDVTVIEFERPEWGGARKMKELRVGDGVFYAQHDDTHYAALFAQQGVDRVPLWFEAKEDDIFNIKWNTANGDFHSMYLIDNLTGVRYDMIRNNSYTFEGHKGDYPSRFLIVFNVTDLEENIELDNFVFFDGLQWIVTGNGVLQFIDLNGQILLEKNVNGGQTRVNVPEVARGMYMFRLTNAKETKVQKVIVNR
jgi:hypothetical protein